MGLPLPASNLDQVRSVHVKQQPYPVYRVGSPLGAEKASWVGVIVLNNVVATPRPVMYVTNHVADAHVAHTMARS